MSKFSYPDVFIHGFVGFGEGEGLDKLMHYWGFSPFKNAMTYLRKQGHEVYYPNVGPFNSAWDRACILYAYLMGGTVDFGRAHSEKYGHARYGRTYPGVLKDWGKPGKHEKINLIGHSFGGPTVIVFSDLLQQGSEEERKATPPEELNPLFKGGQGDLLHTVTTLSGVNNGTTLASGLLRHHGNSVASYLVMMLVAAFGENRKVLKFYDFDMEQWGIMKDPSKVKKDQSHNPRDFEPEMDRFCENKLDSIGHEMMIEYRYEMNKNTKANPNTYYFARIAKCSKQKSRKNTGHKPTKDASILGNVACRYTGNYWSKSLEQLTGGSKEEWMANDGFVNVKGQMAPFTLPSEERSLTGPFETSGLWYNLPAEPKDHVAWCGMKVSKKDHYKYYKDMVELFDSLPDGNK